MKNLTLQINDLRKRFDVKVNYSNSPTVFYAVANSFRLVIANTVCVLSIGVVSCLAAEGNEGAVFPTATASVGAASQNTTTLAALVSSQPAKGLHFADVPPGAEKIVSEALGIGLAKLAWGSDPKEGPLIAVYSVPRGSGFRRSRA
jgi:hypothetical protein